MLRTSWWRFMFSGPEAHDDAETESERRTSEVPKTV
jgi:hypothetical protein